ncbi:MAG: hydrogenase maturation protease, partial [Candidatus Limnocylindrales bacterium]
MGCQGLQPPRGGDGAGRSEPLRLLIAGVGNVLRGDDGFGVEVARRLESAPLPDGVRVVETGIGGIALVQELQEGWDGL